MKPKYFLLGFMAISILAFGSMVQAATTYKLGVGEGSSITYTVVKADSEMIASGTEGSTVTMEISNVAESSSTWTVTFKVGSDSGSLAVSKTPSVGAFVIYVCPVPVADYLTALTAAWNDAYSAVFGEDLASVSGTMWKLDFQGEGWEITFDATTGWATSIKMLENDVVTYEISGVPAGSIPGYELPLLLAIGGITTFGIMYTMMKKRQ